MWSWLDSNQHLPPISKRLHCPLCYYPSPVSSSGPPHPSRIVDRTPIGLTVPMKKIVLLSVPAYAVAFVHNTSLVSRGQLRLSPPASSDGWISLQVRSLLPSCCQHVKELCLCAPRRTCTAVCPSLGVLLTELPGWPSSREAMKLTKLRNVLRCLLHPYNAVCRLQPAVHKLAVVEFRAPNMGIAVSLGKCSPGGALIVEDVLCHVSLIVHD